MINVLKSLVPTEYQKDSKRFMYYLRTLKDKVYKKDIIEISNYQVQILKDSFGLIIVIHQNYITTSTKLTFNQIQSVINQYFNKKKSKKI